MEGYLLQEDSDKILGSILLKVHKGCERLINGFDSGSKQPVLEDHKTQLVSYDLTVLRGPPSAESPLGVGVFVPCVSVCPL